MGRSARRAGSRGPGSRGPGRREPDRGDGPPPWAAAEAIEEHRDGAWVVRRITGATSAKTYRCPGCDQEIRPATPHVVAWPTEAPLLGGDPVDARRHWHTRCWTRR